MRVARGSGTEKKPEPDLVATIKQGDFSRSIAYDDREIPTVHTRLKYTTIFVLPKSEKVMDILCGDKDAWTINGADGTNFAYVKPEKAGARTNLNLVTVSGNVYTFLLVEGGGQADLKVVIEAKETAMLKQMSAAPKWISAAEMDAVRQQAELARQAADTAKRTAEAAKADATRSIDEIRTKASEELAAFRSGFPSSLKHDYIYRDKRQFAVQAIAHSKDFTYIWADPQETPTLYEVKDGKPALINFQFDQGVYIVPKVLDAGYLAVGKRRLNFKRGNLSDR